MCGSLLEGLYKIQIANTHLKNQPNYLHSFYRMLLPLSINVMPVKLI